MSDQTTAAPPPAGSGQTPPENTPAGVPGTGAQPQYITLEQAKKLADDAAEAAFRRAQGLVTKTNQGLENKIRADIQAIEQTVAMQRASGIQITPEQEATLKQNAVLNAYKAAPPEPPPGASPGTQSPAGSPGQQVSAGQEGEEIPVTDPLMDQAIQIMDQAGVYILQTDPEWNVIAQAQPAQYLQAVQDGIASKVKRLATPPEARLSGLGAGSQPASPLPQNLSPIELLKLAHKQK